MWSDWDVMRRFELTLLVLLVIFISCVLIAPFTLPAGSVEDLSGKIGTIDNYDQISKMNPFAQAVYYMGDLNCHQMSDRSFYLNDNELPICARDLAIFIGTIVTVGSLLITSFRPRFYMVIALAVPMAVDGGLQAVTSYESTNIVRVITGSIGGAAVAFFVAIIAFEVLGNDAGKNQHDQNDSPD
jgi:uncharacterized membrane protein